MRSFRKLTFLFCMLTAVSFVGCGYTTKVVIPSGIKSIYVPNFKNSIPLESHRTYEAGLEIDLTNQVLDQLIYDGNLKVVEKEEADAILRGELIRYEQETLRYTSDEGVSQYRLFLVVKIVLYDQRNNEVLWTEGNFTGDTEYFIEGTNATSESAAAEKLMEDLGKKIVNRIVEDW